MTNTPTPSYYATFVQNHAKIGMKHVRRTDAAFMMQSYDDQVATIGHDTPRVHQLWNEIFDATRSVPAGLKYLYLAQGYPDRETHYNAWTLFSLERIREHTQSLRKGGQLHVVDVGIAYCGMGHVCVLSVDTRTGRLFYRHDGGSNGFERETRADELLALQESPEHTFDIHAWIADVETEKQPFTILEALHS